jgi:hypothetical protein
MATLINWITAQFDWLIYAVWRALCLKRMQAKIGAVDPFDPFGIAQGKTFAQSTLSIALAVRLQPREIYAPAW